jgi:hydrogenase expression/formation protein HypC
MCLAVPMRLIEIAASDTAVAELEGVKYPVNVSLIENPQIGDYLIVHAGFAIEKLNQEEANERLALFDEIARSVASSR